VAAVTAAAIRTALAVLAGAALFALLLWLGFWQLERARYKDGLEEDFAAAHDLPAAAPMQLLAGAGEGAWQFRRTVLAGHADIAHQYLLDNRTLAGRAGYHVLLAVASAQGNVLVNRGWVPVGPDRSQLPAVALDAPSIEVRGRLVRAPRPGLLLGSAGYDAPRWPKVVQAVDLEQISRQLGLSLLPAIVLLDGSHPACLRCDWKAIPGLSASGHRGYAVQWFALAGALLAIAVVVTRARRRWHVR